MVNFLTVRWKDKVIFNEERIKKKLDEFAEAIESKCSVLNKCVGFIDGTNREVCRPIYHQRVWYSGHKHYNYFKFQAWVTPDGIISHIFGPVPGHRHDLYLWTASGLEESVFSKQPFNNYYLFGDQGYRNYGHLLAPIAGIFLSEAEKCFNDSMIDARLSVEWGFMRVSQLWQFLSRPYGLKTGCMPVGQLYLVAVLLTNMRTCLHRDKGNIISRFFGLTPPTCEEYLE